MAGVNIVKKAITALVTLVSLNACSPMYVLEAAYKESGILLRRKEIDQVLASSDTTELERNKLEIVKSARLFAIEIGLNPGQSFTKYSTVSQDVLAWVLMASKPDAFSLHTWWFPIVGSVPYKGYFDKSSAECNGRSLERRGYEIYIRGTDAFSTLGWFNDPVLSTTLKHSDTRIANTVIHESLHSTVWIPNYVDFNESLANFVGAQGAIDFFHAQCQRDPTSNCLERTATARLDKEREFELGNAISKLYSDLEQLYKSEVSSAEKISRRDDIFATSIAPLRAKYPQMKILQKVNNSEIMQLRIYLKQLDQFERLFNRRQQNWLDFLNDMREIKRQIEVDSSINPFELLGKL